MIFYYSRFGMATSCPSVEHIPISASLRLFRSTPSSASNTYFTKKARSNSDAVSTQPSGLNSAGLSDNVDCHLEHTFSSCL